MSRPESVARTSCGAARPSVPPLKRFTPLGEAGSNVQPAVKKKTLGRVKIEMKYIDEKQKRMICFSKRKTGLMKKAYELSALTGTQVMLLVASETGHVYTFATKKLQPIITSDAGKTLIQTCLNTPDDEELKKDGNDRDRPFAGLGQPVVADDETDEEEEADSEGGETGSPFEEEDCEEDSKCVATDGKVNDIRTSSVPTNGVHGSIVFRKADAHRVGKLPEVRSPQTTASLASPPGPPSSRIPTTVALPTTSPAIQPGHIPRPSLPSLMQLPIPSSVVSSPPSVAFVSLRLPTSPSLVG